MEGPPGNIIFDGAVRAEREWAEDSTESGFSSDDDLDSENFSLTSSRAPSTWGSKEGSPQSSPKIAPRSAEDARHTLAVFKEHDFGKLTPLPPRPAGPRSWGRNTNPPTIPEEEEPHAPPLESYLDLHEPETNDVDWETTETDCNAPGHTIVGRDIKGNAIYGWDENDYPIFGFTEKGDTIDLYDENGIRILYYDGNGNPIYEYVGPEEAKAAKKNDDRKKARRAAKKKTKKENKGGGKKSKKRKKQSRKKQSKKIKRKSRRRIKKNIKI